MARKNDACPRVDIGGQAVMEGVMMKGPDAIAITVRRPDGTMVVKRDPYVPLSKKHPWMGWPFVRGVVNMVTMLTSGMSTLETSTQMLGVLEEEPSKFEKWLAAKLGKSLDKVVMGVAVVLAVCLSVGLFIMIPAAVETGVMKLGMPKGIGPTLIGGLTKIILLMGYMVLCGFVPDVRRTFQYHGAEHKTVYCHEADLPLTPENAAPFTTLHPRCGTAFLLIVFSISILTALLFAQIEMFILRFLLHLLMLPVVTGVSYEVLKGLAHADNPLARALRWPGLQMQRLTTRQPDEGMLECAIVSMNVALSGLPQNAPTTPEGWAILKSYRESEPGYVFPTPEAEAQA